MYSLGCVLLHLALKHLKSPLAAAIRPAGPRGRAWRRRPAPRRRSPARPVRWARPRHPPPSPPSRPPPKPAAPARAAPRSTVDGRGAAWLLQRSEGVGARRSDTGHSASGDPNTPGWPGSYVHAAPIRRDLRRSASPGLARVYASAGAASAALLAKTLPAPVPLRTSF